MTAKVCALLLPRLLALHGWVVPCKAKTSLARRGRAGGGATRSSAWHVHVQHRCARVQACAGAMAQTRDTRAHSPDRSCSDVSQALGTAPGPTVQRPAAISTTRAVMRDGASPSVAGRRPATPWSAAPTADTLSHCTRSSASAYSTAAPRHRPLWGTTEAARGGTQVIRPLGAQVLPPRLASHAGNRVPDRLAVPAPTDGRQRGRHTVARQQHMGRDQELAPRQWRVALVRCEAR